MQLIVGDVLAVLVARQVQVALQQVPQRLGRLDPDLVGGAGGRAGEGQGTAGEQRGGGRGKKTEA
ncbi:hypothetical protein ACFSUI_15250 [Ralstonia solanacearum]